VVTRIAYDRLDLIKSPHEGIARLRPPPRINPNQTATSSAVSAADPDGPVD